MRVVVITGGSDGIGAELARQLAARDGAGLALVLAARDRDKLEQVAGECAALGAQALAVPTDVADQQQCRHLIAAAAGRFGRIDMLVNNAGRSAHALFEEVPDLGWYEELMRINLWGSVWCTQAALPWLKAARGRIVAVSSLAGLVGVPGRTAYSASKFAMTGFFEALRAELKGAGVSVTIAYPGVVDTRIRYRGFNALGREAGSSGLREEGAMTVRECARLIADGMERRKREVVMTAKGKLGRLMKLLAPGLVEKMAMAALKDELRP
ncbi:short-chain dehydrogenase [Massilia sp. WF1]|uniref:SDR family oxidoreductase n=1 Tax=unclassified Massilia TaxID=2609279 RepID=UPI000691BF4D|nr:MULTISPECIES: SDR family oxidoreductase [unclassified Massilia]ALK97655.1 short-chain dehydrogenase [Massilia sp. WG5]KNZ67766.1 short-chain dehydrogenase [Massilia sp. WF1]